MSTSGPVSGPTSAPTSGPGDAADVLERLWAIVPAGGAGTRLWPLSRSSSPKFLHDLTGQGRTLIQATVDRLAPVVSDRVVVVTGRAHEQAVRAQLPGVERVLAEPSPRDSMAAIGLAAAVLAEREHEARPMQAILEDGRGCITSIGRRRRIFEWQTQLETAIPAYVVGSRTRCSRASAS